MNALIANARFHFHERLFETNTLTLTKAGVASNADTSSRGSKAIAGKIVDILVDEHHHTVNTVDKISGQTLGKQFELLTMEFLQETFPLIVHFLLSMHSNMPNAHIARNHSFCARCGYLS